MQKKGGVESWRYGAQGGQEKGTVVLFLDA
jgi:hypothetical protein